MLKITARKQIQDGRLTQQTNSKSTKQEKVYLVL